MSHNRCIRIPLNAREGVPHSACIGFDVCCPSCSPEVKLAQIWSFKAEAGQYDLEQMGKLRMQNHENREHTKKQNCKFQEYAR
eukprot:4760801-Amphidinium_carterae.1